MAAWNNTQCKYITGRKNMDKPIKHDLGSTIATGTWEAAKGAAVGVSAMPAAGAAIGAIITVAFISSGIGAVLMGALAGGVALGVASVPVAGFMAAAGAFLGLGRGADKVSRESAAYMGKTNSREMQVQQAQMVAANTGLQQGYQAGFQEGQQYAVQQIQQELQQQAMQQQQPHEKHAQHELPADGHVAREMQRRGGQHHASKTDMVTHQKEQAAQGHQGI
jgi:hypothetical protein